MESTLNTPVSASAEDYVKAIYALTVEPDQAASIGQIAERLGVTAGSVSTMVKRMDSAGIAEHLPYRGVRLTLSGRQLALTVIRRHRLLELFLSRSLDIPWEDVHRFADALEHAASDELIELIAAKLGDPVADPHGDPIPNRLLEVDDSAQPTLADLTPGERGRVVRVSDAQPQMLRYLSEQGVAIGIDVVLVERQPFDGPCLVRLKTGAERSLGIKLARAIQIERDTPRGAGR